MPRKNQIHVTVGSIKYGDEIKGEHIFQQNGEDIKSRDWLLLAWQAKHSQLICKLCKFEEHYKWHQDYMCREHIHQHERNVWQHHHLVQPLWDYKYSTTEEYEKWPAETFMECSNCTPRQGEWHCYLIAMCSTT